jgi:hypothetical protein
MLVMTARATEKRPRKQRLKLDYFFGDAACDILEAIRVREEFKRDSLSIGSLSSAWRQTPDHVATARDFESGRLFGLVTASRQLTTSEPFLLVEEALFDSAYDPAALLRRLLAMMMLHVAGVNGMPAAIALRAASDRTAEAFLSLADCFTGAVRYPPQEGTPVALASARLAKRIAKVVSSSIRYDVAASALRGARILSIRNGIPPGVYGASTAFDLTAAQPVTAYDELLLVVDLRLEEETVLIDDARRAYRKP